MKRSYLRPPSSPAVICVGVARQTGTAGACKSANPSSHNLYHTAMQLQKEAVAFDSMLSALMEDGTQIRRGGCHFHVARRENGGVAENNAIFPPFSSYHPHHPSPPTMPPKQKGGAKANNPEPQGWSRRVGRRHCANHYLIRSPRARHPDHPRSIPRALLPDQPRRKALRGNRLARPNTRREEDIRPLATAAACRAAQSASDEQDRARVLEAGHEGGSARTPPREEIQLGHRPKWSRFRVVQARRIPAA